MAEAPAFDVVGRTLLETATAGPWQTFKSSRMGHSTLGLESAESEEMIFWEVGGGLTGAEEADAALIAHMRSAYPVALDAIDRVHALHRPIVESDFWRACAECSDEDAEYVVAWPCPTVRAIGGAS